MPLHIERHDRVALLTLDDPDRKNALSLPLVDEIIAAFDDFESDDSIGAVVITGAGTVFCAGADTSALAAFSSADATPEERAGVSKVYDGFLRVLRSTLPTIAAVNGPAVGAGFNLALACDLRLAGENARFDAKFLRIGLHPGGGHLWLLERAVGPQAAAAITLFSNPLKAEAAVTRGLAWSSHTNESLLPDAIAMAQRAAEAPKALSMMVKSSLQMVPWQPTYDAALATELERQMWSFTQGWFGK